MNGLYLMSLSFALFGSWHLCHLFVNHTQKTYSVKMLDQPNTIWILVSVTLLVGSLLSYHRFGSLIITTGLCLCASLAMLKFGSHTRLQTSLQTSIIAVGFYSVIMLLFALILVHILG